MALQVTAIMLGVRDLTRSKKFYGEGLGGTIDKDYPAFVSLSLGDGSSSLALYERETAAKDAGVSAEGSGFTGISFHYIVAARETVDEVIASAVAAGGAVVKEAAGASVGWVLRVLQRPGRLPLEGRHLRLTAVRGEATRVSRRSRPPAGPRVPSRPRDPACRELR